MPTGAQLPGGGTADVRASDVADLVISPDGAFLYTHSRTDTSIGVYQRNEANGAPAYLEKIYPRCAREPRVPSLTDPAPGGRSFAISASGDRLYATADGDDSVAVFRRNTTTGRLELIP